MTTSLEWVRHASASSGDFLQIRVGDAPAQTLHVGALGRVETPQLGALQVGGLTMAEIAARYPTVTAISLRRSFSCSLRRNADCQNGLAACACPNGRSTCQSCLGTGRRDCPSCGGSGSVDERLFYHEASAHPETGAPRLLAYHFHAVSVEVTPAEARWTGYVDMIGGPRRVRRVREHLALATAPTAGALSTETA